MHPKKDINSRCIYETCHEFPKSMKAGEFHQFMADTCKQLRHENSKWPSNDFVNNIADDFGSCNRVIPIKICWYWEYDSAEFGYPALDPLVLLLPINLIYLAFKLFECDRTWWRLFEKRAVRAKFDIYVFISMAGSILLVVDY